MGLKFFTSEGLCVGFLKKGSLKMPLCKQPVVKEGLKVGKERKEISNTLKKVRGNRVNKEGGWVVGVNQV